MSYSYNKNYPANAGKTNYGLNSFAAYLAKEDEKKKKETPPYKPESQKKTLTPFEKMADISKNIAGGARIKQNVEDALTKNYPSGNYKGIFDGIDEKKIENNISLADDVIKKNTAGGAYKITPRENLPWLRDGLALFYASAEQGDSKAANAARTAAYTEEKQPEAKSSDDIPDFFGNALKRFEDDNSRTTNQTFFASPKRTKVNSGQQEIAENEKEKSKTGNTKVLDAVKNSSTIRYAGEDKIRFYTDATIKSENVDLISLGDKVIYLGEKKKTDNTEWAKVKYNGKTGWVKSEYLKTQKSAVKGDIFAYLTNELTDNDIKAGLKVVEKGNEFYYDYTDVIMNQINKVLPDFYENDVLTYQEYTEKYAKKYDNELLSEHYVYYPTHTEYQAYVLKRLLYFTSQVTHGAPWDIKVDSSWQTQFGDVRMPYYDGTEKNDEWFLFRGELVTREDLGNITYGYLGSAMGLGEKTLYWGAGVANNWKEGIIKGKAYVYDAEKPYGDTPEDHNFVKRGIELYYEDYPEAKPGINRTIP